MTTVELSTATILKVRRVLSEDDDINCGQRDKMSADALIDAVEVCRAIYAFLTFGARE